MKYDLAVIVFAKADLDARSLNFVRAAAAELESVLYISLKPDSIPELPGNVTLKYIELNNSGRVLSQWIEFHKKAKILLKDIPTDRIMFADLYALSLAGFMKRRSGKKIYDSREIYSSLGPIAKNKLKQKIISAFEKRMIRYIDEFVVSGELDADYLKKYFKTNKKFHVILNLPEYKEALNINLIRRKFNISGERVIFLYQGALVKNRGLYKFMDALKFLEGPVLVITGEGPDEANLRRYASEKGLNDSVLFSGKIPYDTLHEWTCSADAGISLFEPVSLSYEYSLPNKLFEFFMAGKPVLATDLTAMRAVFDKYPAGLLVDKKLEPENIADAAIELLNPDKYNERKEFALKAAQEYNYGRQRNIILKVLD